VLHSAKSADRPHCRIGQGRIASGALAHCAARTHDSRAAAQFLKARSQRTPLFNVLGEGPCSRSGAWRLYGTNVSIRCGHGCSAPEFVRAYVAISAPSRDVAPADIVMKSAHYPPWPLGTNTDALAYVARSSPAAQLLFASGGPFRRVCFFETSTPLLAPLDFRAGHTQRASD